MPGQFSLSVVNDELLAFADNKDGGIFAKLLLEPELQGEVQEARHYFDPEENEAKAHLDLLMMSSGWRRFGWEAIGKDAPTVSVPAEKSILKGHVVDRWTGQNLPNVKMELLGSDISVQTNAEGAFNFPFFDISDFNTLKLSAKNQEDQEIQLTDYNANAVFYMNGPDRPVMFRGGRMKALGMPEVAMAEMDFEAVEEDEMVFNVAAPIEVIR